MTPAYGAWARGAAVARRRFGGSGEARCYALLRSLDDPEPLDVDVELEEEEESDEPFFDAELDELSLDPEEPLPSEDVLVSEESDDEPEPSDEPLPLEDPDDA